MPTSRKIQSVFALSDGSGLAVTVARYETPAHTDIDKVSTALHKLTVETNDRWPDLELMFVAKRLA